MRVGYPGSHHLSGENQHGHCHTRGCMSRPQQLLWPTIGGGGEIPGKSPPYLGFSWGKAGKENPTDFPRINLGKPLISRVFLGKSYVCPHGDFLPSGGKSHDFPMFSPQMISLGSSQRGFPSDFPGFSLNCTAVLLASTKHPRLLLITHVP